MEAACQDNISNLIFMWLFRCTVFQKVFNKWVEEKQLSYSYTYWQYCHVAISSAWKMDYEMKVSQPGKADEKAHLKGWFTEIIKGQMRAALVCISLWFSSYISVFFL